MSLDKINVNMRDGKLLMAAIAIITTESRTDQTPYEVIEALEKGAIEMGYDPFVSTYTEILDFGKTKEKLRGFENVILKHMKSPYSELPEQGSVGSAGYDFKMPIDTILKPGEKILVFTNVKAYMQNDEVLELYIRSSLGVKKGLVLSNQVGIIDSDYYSNSSNDGNIGIPLRNTSSDVIHLKKGEKVAQGIFKHFLRSDNCNSIHSRTGGFGSTGVETPPVCKHCAFATDITMAGLLCDVLGDRISINGDPEIMKCSSFKRK